MGLRIRTSIETPQGFTASSLYLRIVSLFVLLPQAETPLVKIRTTTYLSRERKDVVGSEIELPSLPREFDINIPLSSLASFEILYAYIYADLRKRGFLCDHVAEEGQILVPYVVPVMDVSGSVVDVSGSVVDVSGSVVDVSGSVVDVSGSVVDVSGSVVDVSGSVVDVSGSVVDVSGSVI